MKNVNIKNLLSQMTLEEKIGQLTQIRTSYYYHTDTAGTGTKSKLHIDEEQKWMIGSLLGDLDAHRMREIQTTYLAKNRLKIPLLFMQDIIHGFRTIFPIPLAMSCSWNEEMIEKAANIAAQEGGVSGYQVTFSPMVDLVRDPRWGRVIESFGEDTLLNERFGAAMVRGYQGDDLKSNGSLASCVKHFAAYGAAEGGRDYNTVDLSETRLRNDYFPPYKAAIDAGAQLVMASFNVLNGTPATGNTWLLQDILRDEWSYKGIVISDWGAVKELIRHGVAGNSRDAAKLALSAGIDIEMATTAYYEALPQLCENHLILEYLDQAVERVLLLKEACGLFQDPYRGISEELEKETLYKEEFIKTAREIAGESMVLLENKGILPLNPNQKILLLGPYAKNPSLLGPWSLNGRLEETVTFEMGIKEQSNEEVEVIETSFEEVTEAQVKCILEKAESADAIVIALGEEEYKSGEAGSLSQLKLPLAQIELVKRVKKVGKPLVVCLVTGRPLEVEEIAKEADGFLLSWFPGSEGGHALADILYGQVNPSGRLTMSFPRNVGQIPLYYNHLSTGRPQELLVNEKRYTSKYLDVENTPLYPFGYGKSYSTVEYRNLQLESNSLKENGQIQLTIDLYNKSQWDVKETVQVYIRDKVADISRPVRQLVEFAKVSIKAYSMKTLILTIDEKQLRYWNGQKVYKSDPGNFDCFIGKDSEADLCFEIKRQ